MIKNSIITLSGLFLTILVAAPLDSICNNHSFKKEDDFHIETMYSAEDTVFINEALETLSKEISLESAQNLYCRAKEILPFVHYRKSANLPHQQVQLLSVAALCKKENCLMISMVSRNLSDLFDLLGYWQSIRSRPLHYFTTHLPTQFLNKETQTKLADEAIAVITSSITFHATYLARLHENFNSLNNATQIADIQNCVAQAISIMNSFFAQDLTVPEASLANIEDTYQALIKHHQTIALYQKTFIESLIKYQKPGHFERNWLRYTIAGTVALGSAAYWYTHQDQISKNCTQTYDSLKKLFTEHLYEPIKKAIHHYKNNDQKNIPQNNDEKIEDLKYLIESFESTKKVQIKVIAQHLLDSKAFKNYEDALKEATHVVTTGEYKPLEQFLIDSGNVSFSGMLDTLKALLLEARKIYLDAGKIVINGMHDKNKMIEQWDKFREDNAVTYQALLTIPVIISVIGIYFSYKITKSITNDLIDTQYNPVRETLLSIENILNHFNKSTREIPENQQGMIFYLLHKLQLYISHIPKKHHQDQFLQDLKQIESHNYSIDQKLATINRMFRSHEFLTFNGHKSIKFTNLNSLFGSQEAQQAENCFARVL